MASFTERLGYIITANGRDAVREFRSVRDAAKRDLGGTESMLGKFNASASGVGAGLKGFGAGLVASLGLGVVDDLTTAASQLEQSAGAIESVFGDAKGEIEAFGETAAETAGLSKREVNEMASVIGAQLQGMGFSAEEAAEKVVVLQKRAADMAATFGGPTSKALEAISSALRKERDPIEQYGVTIGEADVKTRAAALGLDDTTFAAKKYGGALATLDLILEGTAKTQGQWNRELDTAAGAQSAAAASYENAKAKLGEELLPAKTGLTKLTTDLVRWGDTAVRWGGKLVQLYNGWGDMSDDTADKQEDLAEAVDEVAYAAQQARISVEDYRSTLDDMQASAFDVEDAQDKVTSSLRSLVDLATDTDDKRADSAEKVADAIERANERIRDAERAVRDAREDAGKVNVPGAERDAANERLREAEERLADVRREGEENISKARETADELERWTPALDRASASGLKNRDLFRDHVDLVLETATTMLEQGATAQEINTYLRTQRDLLGETAAKVGFSRDAMREFLTLLSQAEALTPNPGAVMDPFGNVAGIDSSRVPGAVFDPFGNVAGTQNINVFTGYVDDPHKLAEIVGREISRQLRRRA